MPEGRQVGEFYCSDVLARLSDFLDGELSEDDQSLILEHLAGCDWCERFGADFSSLVAKMREELTEAAPVPAEVERRLWARLDGAD